AVPTRLTILRGAVVIQSQLVAMQSADLRGVMYPGYPNLQVSQDQVDQTITLRVTNLTFRYTVTPDTGPIDFAAADVFLTCNVTARAHIPRDVRVLPLASLSYPHIEGSLTIVTQQHAGIGAPAAPGAPPMPFMTPPTPVGSPRPGGPMLGVGPAERIVVPISGQGFNDAA
ncbi:hypothetical protein Vretifemale_3101, partial [Volvox reticuliferus]